MTLSEFIIIIIIIMPFYHFNKSTCRFFRAKCVHILYAVHMRCFHSCSVWSVKVSQFVESYMKVVSKCGEVTKSCVFIIIVAFGQEWPLVFFHKESLVFWYLQSTTDKGQHITRETTKSCKSFAAKQPVSSASGLD